MSPDQLLSSSFSFSSALQELLKQNRKITVNARAEFRPTQRRLYLILQPAQSGRSRRSKAASDQ